MVPHNSVAGDSNHNFEQATTSFDVPAAANKGTTVVYDNITEQTMVN